ncbi:LysR substrate-binding domain-containing protein [Neobacillus sp. OS1-32]|jgi:DNA-binding transcriptional LysR family regulator|uniref:LysR family transcriptional regulator n=1 Tax=Neobacillus paridis TaxID=2803862 RepID=A0ABS1TPV8_9BACI|nr:MULTISPECIES: LysR substrate-binding domain-containing protein [Neobacillus]MBL4953345.1 LysR family transcriptional regulator [Neobacillus paridis]WML29569.1 LysR substrate-binding domain-containing protein [Neobacillus sp. OS1-32]
MELRHIRYFLALAEELNFGRAAERLHIAQPPLSRQIQELEEEIGAKLFYRTKRHVELTNAGKVFLNKAYQILDQVEQACVSTRLSSTGAEGEVVIGFSGTVQDLIPVIQKYHELYPHVGITLHQMNTANQIKALNEKRIDIGIVAAPVNSNKIHVRPLTKVCFLATLPEKHPLANKHSINLRDLADETFIMTPKSAGVLYYETFMSIFQMAGFAPKIMIQANDLQSVLALVAAGMGVALTPSSSTPCGGVIQRKVEDINVSLEASIAWRKDNHSEILDKLLKSFFNFFHIEFENIVN